MNLKHYDVQEMNAKEIREVDGAFVLGLAVGALVAWAVYEITH